MDSSSWTACFPVFRLLILCAQDETRHKLGNHQPAFRKPHSPAAQQKRNATSSQPPQKQPNNPRTLNNPTTQENLTIPTFTPTNQQPRHGRLYHILEPTRGFPATGAPKAKAWVEAATSTTVWTVHPGLYPFFSYGEIIVLHISIMYRYV